MSQDALKKIISLSSDVTEIVNNFLSDMTISYFQYDKCNQNHQRIILTSRPEWLLHCIDNAYYKISYFESKLSGYSSKIQLWKHVNKISAPIFNAAENHFNMHNGISLISRQGENTEYYHFAFSKINVQEEMSVADWVNNLHKFINYFKKSAEALLVKSTKNLFVYPDESVFDAGFNGVVNKDENTAVPLFLKKF